MSRSMLARAVTAVLAATILTASVAVAQVAPPEGDRQAMKALCKQDGYARVVGVMIGDPNERVAFRNQGQCVSFVNQGGILVGISDPED